MSYQTVLQVELFALDIYVLYNISTYVLLQRVQLFDISKYREYLQKIPLLFHSVHSIVFEYFTTALL